MRINYNYLRTLAKKQKSRPVLQCLHYDNNKITFTDGIILLQIYSRHELTNTNINLLDHTVNYAPYPNLDQLMSRGYEPRQIEQIIHENSIAYVNRLKDSKFMIDSDILDSIKKLLSIKELNPDDFTFYGSALKYKPNDGITLIHMLKRYTGE